MLSGQKKLKISEKQAENQQKELRGTIPFLTRRAKDIKIILNQDATVDGFINFPIYTFFEYGLDEP